MEEHPQARQIIDTITKAGFIAYYAGGWVRDLLLNHPSDDIDIATNAPPETIQALFPHTVPVGIAFGIVVVIIEDRQYEVATFREDIDYKDGRRPTKIAFTTAIEDARRRDFTINGMFYDPLKEEVLDYVDGKADLEAKIIRAIGDPHQRIKEDRLRMLRAIRLSCRFHFTIEPKTEKAIKAHAKELFPAVAIERIYQEFKKGHGVGILRKMLIHLHEYHLLETIFPPLKGVSLKEITKRLEPLKKYPIKAPVIAYLLPLFPESALQEQIELCQKLKLSRLDQQFVSFLFHVKELVHLDRPVERIEWAYVYANSFASISLQILSCHLESRRQLAFLKEHEEAIATLHKWIERIKTQDPLVKSEHLKKHGIEPGVRMGKILKEAERVAINEDIEDPEIILAMLKDPS